jgi:hypothetical protein
MVKIKLIEDVYRVFHFIFNSDKHTHKIPKSYIVEYDRALKELKEITSKIDKIIDFD